MKSLNFYKSTIVLSAILLLSSCGLDMMVSKFNTLNYNVTPPQVEVHGGTITIEMEVTIPEKYFQKTASAEFRPALALSADSPEKVFFDPITLQGEKVSSNGKTIGYVTGGTFKYKGTLEYSPEMVNYDLFATATASINDNSKSLGTIKIADGVMATATRVQNNEEAAYSSHNYEKETILEEIATIYFTVNQSNVRYSQKSSDEIKRLKDFAKLGYTTKQIEITSFASPEGSLDINDKVSGDRAKSTFSYAKQLMRQLKIDNANNDQLYINKSNGEDWDGFNSLVNSSNMKDKSKVLNIVRSQKDPQKREEAIRDMAEIYDAIEDDVLPKLRKATITLKVYEPKKTDEEIVTLAISDPSQLDIKELLYAATIINDKASKNIIYDTTTKAYPSDHKAFNNLASLNIMNKDFNSAKMNLGKAAKLNPNAKEVIENQGIIAAIEGDLQQAKILYAKSNASENNQGILAIKMGDYATAVAKLKGNDFNATLAKIMNGNNAITIDESAQGHYLNAISYARAGDNTKCLEHLAKAIAQNDLLKNEARQDIEFKNLNSNLEFQALLN